MRVRHQDGFVLGGSRGTRILEARTEIERTEHHQSCYDQLPHRHVYLSRYWHIAMNDTDLSSRAQTPPEHLAARRTSVQLACRAAPGRIVELGAVTCRSAGNTCRLSPADEDVVVTQTPDGNPGQPRSSRSHGPTSASGSLPSSR